MVMEFAKCLSLMDFWNREAKREKMDSLLAKIAKKESVTKKYLSELSSLVVNDLIIKIKNS